jgi:hypothetical protein
MTIGLVSKYMVSLNRYSDARSTSWRRGHSDHAYAADRCERRSAAQRRRLLADGEDASGGGSGADVPAIRGCVLENDIYINFWHNG